MGYKMGDNSYQFHCYIPGPFEPKNMYCRLEDLKCVRQARLYNSGGLEVIDDDTGECQILSLSYINTDGIAMFVKDEMDIYIHENHIESFILSEIAREAKNVNDLLKSGMLVRKPKL
jgi:hypothetical protein